MTHRKVFGTSNNSKKKKWKKVQVSSENWPVLLYVYVTECRYHMVKWKLTLFAVINVIDQI